MPSSLTVCGVCRVRIRRDRLARHLLKVHGLLGDAVKNLIEQRSKGQWPKAVLQGRLRRSDPNNWVYCPQCDLHVLRNELSQHLATAHSAQVGAKPTRL